MKTHGMQQENSVNWKRAISVWLLIAVAESVHGTLRQLFLVPQIGEKLSHQIGVVAGSAFALSCIIVFQSMVKLPS